MRCESEGFSDSRVLIVDDEERNVRLLRSVLEADDYTNIESTSDSRRVVELFLDFKPDLVLLDLRMPYMDGFEVLRQLDAIVPEDSFLPIIVLTADITQEARERALSEGASDFLTKPFDITEVLLRIKNLLRTRHLNQSLEERVRERTQEIKATQLEVLERLARAAEYRDDDTGQHTQRVGEAATILAREMNLPEEQVKLIRRTAPLHDVGKIGVPDTILLKPSRLTPEEFDVMKTHTLIGAKLLSGGSSPLIKVAELIALSHHERWDGTGYPHKLAGDAIPIEGRILAVVDVFDALTHERPYKHAWTLREAMDEIEQQSHHQFDPRVVKAFLKCHRQNLI
jgi:putative two-component system response regulator